MENQDIERLIAAGSYADAARALEGRGELDRAQALLERIWDFQAAAGIARRRGDRPDLLRLLIDAKDLPGVARALADLDGAPREERVRAAEILERKRLLPEAARQREAVGEFDAARDLYRKGGLPLDAARLDEAMGHLREAGAAYERFLAEGPGSPEAPRAEAALGRLLGGFGRHEDAARHLQRGLRAEAAASERTPGLEEECRRQLVVELAALGYSEGAHQLLDELRAADPRLEPLDAFLARRARAAAKAGSDGEGPLLAGRYAIVRMLGSGGMGRVYLAHDRLAGRDVAVKVVAAPVDARAREGYARFVREARVVSTLKHPNLVAVHDFHEAEGLLVMELMGGGTLADRLLPGKGGLAPRRAQNVLRQLIAGLAAAHARGVIHRDIKPANVFHSSTGTTKLGDFGVAHLQDLGATQTGGFIGTLAYMSPEQITGAKLSYACDVYALGVTAFQMLTGSLPFCGPDFVGQHLGETAPAPSTVKPALGRAFDGLIARMLAKDPAERFATLDELARSLEEIEVTDAGADMARPVVTEAVPEGVAVADAPRYRLESEEERTPHSVVYRGLDDRLGRAVIVEQFNPGWFDTDAGGRHFAWLRAMARHGGPHLQRVLRIERDGGTARLVYEAPVGAPLAPSPKAVGTTDLAAEARLLLGLCRALAGPHAEGVAHGSLARSIVVEANGPMVFIAGRLPGAGTPGDDLRYLQELARGTAGGAGAEALGDLAEIAAFAAARV